MDSKELKIQFVVNEGVKENMVEQDMDLFYEDLTNLNIGPVTNNDIGNSKKVNSKGEIINQIIQQFIIELPTVIVLEGLIQLLSNWVVKRKKYTITIENEHGKFVISGADREKLLEMVMKLTETQNE